MLEARRDNTGWTSKHRALVGARGAECIEVFHTRDQNHVTAGANPFWGSSFEQLQWER